MLKVLLNRLNSYPAPNILLVENDTQHQILFDELFSSLGLNVEVVKNSVDAEHSVTANSYDLVYVNVNLPADDGLAAVTKIRALCSEDQLPIVGLVDAASTLSNDQILPAGINTRLINPVAIAELLESIMRFWQPEEALAKAMADPVGTLTLELASVRAIFESDSFDSSNTLMEQIGEVGYLRVANAFVKGMQEELEGWCKKPVLSNQEVHSLLHKLKGSAGCVGAVKLAAIIVETQGKLDGETEIDLGPVMRELEHVVSVLSKHFPD
jgi:CheY-like chemotaxis protein